MTSYTIRNASSPEEVRRAVTQCAADEQWEIGMDDHELLFATDQSGIFIGELNGERISCLCVLKLGDDHAFLGYYIVDKSHRGKGYGLTIFKAGMASLSPNHNCTLSAMADTVHLYEKFGFQYAWTNFETEFNIDDICRILGKVCLLECSVQAARCVDIELLHSYTSEILGSSFHAYLAKMLEAPNILSFVATIGEQVVGFISTKKVIPRKQKKGWKISPLFANTVHIARMLLKKVFSTLSVLATPDEKVSMDIPHDLNPEAYSLGNELNGTFRLETVQMYSKEVPKIPKEKVYSILVID